MIPKLHQNPSRNPGRAFLEVGTYGGTHDGLAQIEETRLNGVKLVMHFRETGGFGVEKKCF